MRNIKRQSSTHTSRFADWQADGAPVTIDLVTDTAALRALCEELIGIDTPDQKQARIAMESTAQGYRENSPELYGRTSSPMFPNGFPVLHGKGEDCNPELTETESALVATTGHNVEVE